jgi:hypothetical protein
MSASGSMQALGRGEWKRIFMIDVCFVTTGKTDKCLSRTTLYEEPFASGKISSEPSLNTITYFSDFQIVLLGRDLTETSLFGEPYYQLSKKTFFFS